MIGRRILTAVVLVMITATTVLGSSFDSGRVFAQQRSQVGSGNALKVAPVRNDFTLDPGTTKTFEVIITNLTSVSARLHPAVNDFIASGDETGTPSIILDEDKYAPSHSLKQFVSPLQDFTLKAGEERNIKVTINIPQDAAGGGYYGAVRFSPAAATGSADKNVNLAASVGSLVLLKVNGEITENAVIKSFDVRKKDKPGSFFMNNKDLRGVVRFQNDGNVQVEPFGTVTLKRFGKKVNTVQVNDNSDGQRGSVLPESIRRFDIPLTNLSSFGKYTLEGNFGYGSTGQLLTAKTTFYVIPLFIILLCIALFFVIVFLVFGLPRMIRAYNRRIIRKASRRR
ncbi:MAG TPA: DUF916 domain-containing protein [Candidatus Saccharimonadales bacterium]|nr:DUF916 domain-containing protein [Candidatus Saccharimonadales bacterium]